jgi:hypothetical protein
MRRKRIVLILTAVATVGLERTSYGDSGTALVARPASVGVVPIELPAGWQINATVVQAAGEPNWATAIDHTILEVFLDPEEILLVEAFPGGGLPASLGLGPNATARTMRMVIRSDHAIQQRFLTAVHFVYRDFTSGQTYDSTPTFVLENTNEGTLVMQNGLVVAAHAGTSMPPGGSNDSLIMVLKNGDQAVQYDDDNGVGLTSWLHLFPTVDGISPCPPGGSCSVLVANVLGRKTITSPTKGTWSSNVAEGAAVRLFWDEDVCNGRDADSDGIGDALEQMLGTRWKGRFANGTDCPDGQPPEQVPGDSDAWNGCKDSDRDGILDVHELGGVPDDPAHESNPWNLLMFSAYGADPAPDHQDIFIETHWPPACTGTNCPGKEAKRFTAGQVERMRDLWLPFHIHVDTGDASCTPADLCGKWGGASMFPDGYNWLPEGHCAGFSPERVGYFHHMLSDNGAKTGVGSRCGWVTNTSGSNPAHEFGHQLGLHHFGGFYDSPDRVTGCKPHYVSIMNYAYASGAWMGDPNAGTGALVPGFSLGLNQITLNAATLDESMTTWGGISSVYPYAQMIYNVFGRKYQDGVGVDWNMDGHISFSGIVQGPLNYALNNHICDRAAFATREGTYAMCAADPSLVVANGALWMLARNGSSGFFAAEGSFTCGTTQGSDGDPCDAWSAAQGIDTVPTVPSTCASVVPGPYPATGAGAIMAFVGDDGELYYMTQPPWEGRGPQSCPQLVPTSDNAVVSGQPVATVDPATQVVSVYAAGGPAGGPYHLLRWDYDPRVLGWTKMGEVQYYDNGSPVEMTEAVGPGLTRGYQEGGLRSSPDGTVQETQGEFAYILLSIPDATYGSRVAMLRQVTASWADPPVQYWTELQSALVDLAQSHVSDVLQVSDARVGLAFRPEPQPTDAGPGVFVSGRFYMTYLGLGDVRQTTEPFVSFTRGNVFWDGSSSRPTERELVMVPFNPFYCGEAVLPLHQGINLVYFDGAVRGVAQMDYGKTADPRTCLPPNISIFPNADGVVNQDQHDYNDVALIARNLRCSLTMSCR